MSTRYSTYLSTPQSRRRVHSRVDRVDDQVFGGSTIRRPLNDQPSLQPPVTCRVTARDLMRPCAATLRPEDSIERAARLMSKTDSSSIPVVDGSGRLIGLITERDITVKLVAQGASIPHAQVSDCMKAEAFACSADSSFESCISAMSWHQLEEILIVDNEHRIVGTISRGDLTCYVCENPQRVEQDAMADILLSLAY